MKRGLPLATFLEIYMPNYTMKPYQQYYFTTLSDAAEPTGNKKPDRIIHGPQRKGKRGKPLKW